MPRAELAALFEGLHASLKRLTDGKVAPPVIETAEPAVSIRKSVTPDYLICLDDGLKFKSLRQHLTKLGMTPEQYRQSGISPATIPWSTCVECAPMVEPNNAAQRSALAKNIGLGQSRKKPVAVVPASPDTIEAAAPDLASVAKSNAKVKAGSKVVGTPPAARVTRKPGRPRKVTA